MYLVGVYLGDGMLTRMPRNVWKLRIFQDENYAGLIGLCSAAMRDIGSRQVAIVQKVGCVEITSHWKHWICVFPQHGPGPKHLRRIQLAAWQRVLVELFPREFVKGLIHSDGCRATNRVKSSAGRSYSYPRYFFTNHSDDIRELFVWACGLIGVDCRPSNRWNISVARRASVAILDEFIGAKS